jgi:hypothetical protein
MIKLDTLSLVFILVTLSYIDERHLAHLSNSSLSTITTLEASSLAVASRLTLEASSFAVASRLNT